MSSQLLPYTVKPHPLTGMYSGKLGIWLFLASEVMLFGALFSSYILLRVGAHPGAWPTGQEAGLSWGIGMFNTAVLITSSITMVLAWAAVHEGNLAKCKKFLKITIGLALMFLFVKITFEYLPKIRAGHTPSHSTFYAIYFTMTGLHGLHVIGGIPIMLYFIGPGAKLFETNPQYYTNRIECTGLYWHFVDLVWIFLFPVMYLL